MVSKCEPLSLSTLIHSGYSWKPYQLCGPLVRPLPEKGRPGHTENVHLDAVAMEVFVVD